MQGYLLYLIMVKKIYNLVLNETLFGLSFNDL